MFLFHEMRNKLQKQKLQKATQKKCIKSYGNDISNWNVLRYVFIII